MVGTLRVAQRTPHSEVDNVRKPVPGDLCVFEQDTALLVVGTKYELRKVRNIHNEWYEIEQCTALLLCVSEVTGMYVVDFTWWHPYEFFNEHLVSARVDKNDE